MALIVITKVKWAYPLVRNLCTKPKNRQIKTAGVIVIGDEILKGDVTDTNSSYITRELHKMGIRLKKISIIGDEVGEISNEVKLFSQQYNYVITSGGIGPTHDDVTFEAVAKAFDVPLVLNRELKILCEKFYHTTDTSHPGMKLALVPQSSKLTFADNTNYPNVSVENVYIFPGIPELFMKSFKSLSSKLFKSEVIFYKKCIYFNITEDKISSELSHLVAEFPDVQFGSYPKMFHSSYRVKVTIESTEEGLVNAACDRLLQKFPRDAIVAVS